MTAFEGLTEAIAAEQAQRRAAWLEERRGLITGSDAAKVLGLSKFGGPIDVYLEKTGELGPVVDTPSPYVEGGRRFEKEILRWYADTEGCRIAFADPFTVHRSTTFKNIGATLDALRPIDGPKTFGIEQSVPVDAKNIRFQTEEWGEDGTDQFPLYYAVQLVIQSHVMAAPFADLPVVFSGQDFVRYRLYRNTDTEAEIAGRLQSFWDDNVVKGIPPKNDGSESFAKYLAQKFQQASDQVIPVTPTLHNHAKELASLNDRIDVLNAEATFHANELKAAIGQAKGIVGSNWKATWGVTKGRTTIDVVSLLGELRTALQIRAGRTNNGPESAGGACVELLHELESLTAKYTKTGAEFRTFRFTYPSK